MPQPSNLDRVRLHACIADYHASEFKGKTYHHVRLVTPYGEVNCQIDPSINPNPPIVGSFGDFLIGIEYRVVRNFRREQVEARRWLLEY